MEEAMRPWWDGTGWRLDPVPEGVPPAPLAEDRWPLVVLPGAVQAARALTFLQAPLFYLVGFLAAHQLFGGVVRELAYAVIIALVALAVVAAIDLGRLRRVSWARLLAAEVAIAAAGVGAIVPVRIPGLGITSGVGALVIALLLRSGVRRAVAAASTPVPYPDLPRLPRVVPPR